MDIFIEEFQFINDTEGYVTSNTRFQKIGSGKSASVFLINGQNKVIKLFYPHKRHEWEGESYAYRTLNNEHKTFIECHQTGEMYLILDYIKGKTLFECLREGIFIQEEWIKEVDKALSFAKGKGLNPSDVHAKNIIKTDTGIKVIDLGRFMQKEECHRWEDLKKAYYTCYTLPFFPKKLPLEFIEEVIRKYKRNERQV